MVIRSSRCDIDPDLGIRKLAAFGALISDRSQMSASVRRSARACSWVDGNRPNHVPERLETWFGDFSLVARVSGSEISEQKTGSRDYALRHSVEIPVPC